MDTMLAAVAGWEPMRGLLRDLQEARSRMVVGVDGPLKSVLLAAIARSRPGPTLVLAPNSERADELLRDLTALLAADPAGRECDRVQLFPSLEILLYEEVSPDYHLIRDRLQVLDALLSGKPQIVIATASAALHRALPPAALAGARWQVNRGDVIPRERLTGQLAALGYGREEMVDRPGQFSVRGGIVDIFPSTDEFPVRLEMYGDEVESIRRFRVDDQRSAGEVDGFTLLPAREILLTPDTLAGMADLRARLAVQTEALQAEDPAAADRLATKVAEDLARLEQMDYFPGVEYYLPYLYPEEHTLFDYLPADTLVVVDEPMRLAENYRSLQEELQQVYENRLRGGRLLPLPAPHYTELAAAMRQARGRPQVSFALLPYAGAEDQDPITLSAPPVENFGGVLDMLAFEIGNFQHQGWSIVLGTGQQDRLAEVLTKAGLVHLGEEAHDAPFGKGQVVITGRGLSGGFQIRDLRLLWLSDQEIFGRQKLRRPLRRRTEGAPVLALTQLEAGDYVVHINHGIGRYEGLVRRTVGEVEREYMAVQYAGADRLYVPADQLDRVQKYLGAGDEPPVLNRLGGPEWERTKRSVRRSARDLAQELIKVQAAREAQPGYAFPPDTPWQREMEDGFPYEETPDQAKAIDDVKGDMEQSKPMDRLICGDVGYGKTEVAVRAAFKAAMDGKQVAVLVPTTVLAQQHEATFSERLAPYPVRVEALSRFKSPREQRRIVEALAAGGVDIIIGTHRLLSADVKFHDLALLIVDEEHRFGVRHKERIKKLKATVEVLTMTATPIPRTLHMALAGMRDLSLITNPPEGRMPIFTKAVPMDDDLVREAILRELDRGGQAYFVHNRVESIHHVAARLQRLVPSARIGIGHGQLPEGHLEKIMVAFYAGDYDVLVCTTIIESGLDIPNCNTIIIDHADQFGLAQLYQLRGRVGRSDRQAYCYLTWTPFQTLTETAEKRIAAIREFTELGAGYQIAVRDLEIRGAGNLLGPEQHGFVTAVGFDLYAQMLAEAVQQARGEMVTRPPEVSIDLPVDAFLSPDYVPSLNQRIDLYRRMAAIRLPETIDSLREELSDRYGRPVPEAAENLLRVIALKLQAAALGMESISTERGQVTILLEKGRRLNPALLRGLRILVSAHPAGSGRHIAPGPAYDRVTLSLGGMESGALFEILTAVVTALGAQSLQPAAAPASSGGGR
jgi:transcription-repair coupling factor (superfamily II helicase)